MEFQDKDERINILKINLINVLELWIIRKKLIVNNFLRSKYQKYTEIQRFGDKSEKTNK